MTTGKSLIKAIREDLKKWPNICHADMFLYDDDNFLSRDKEVEFVEDLFLKNPEERERFIEFLGKFEQENPMEFNVKITEHHVIMNFLTPERRIFNRTPTLSPIDYME